MTRWLMLLGCVASAGCADSCGSDQQLAELTRLSGEEVERDHADSVGSWRAALLHDRFFMGDGVRTGKDSQADLGLLPSGTVRIESRTVLRFLPQAPEARSTRVSLERGALELSAEKMDLEVHTPRAVARVAPGGKLQLSAIDGHERFDLIVGRVQVAYAGTLRTLELREPLELSSTPRAERPEPSDAVAAPAAQRPEPELSPEVAEEPPKPSRSAADLVLGELERATIHTASPPVDVVLPAPNCSHQPKIVLDGKTLGTKEPGLARLSAGQHRVRLLCGSRIVRESRLLVRRDPARLELPTRAQRIRVEADGRNYTVRYQNVLPTVSFVWPEAPAGDLFTLVMRQSGHEASYQVPEPAHTLGGDALHEGDYEFWFLDAQDRPSQVGTLRLTFDNTARSAYLSSPVEGSSPKGDRVLVAGATLSRSDVSVDGAAVQLDDKGRFRVESHVIPGQRAVAVRIAHPEGGVHYYLRRLR